jgi:hypothetical protein
VIIEMGKLTLMHCRLWALLKAYLKNARMDCADIVSTSKL